MVFLVQAHNLNHAPLNLAVCPEKLHNFIAIPEPPATHKAPLRRADLIAWTAVFLILPPRRKLELSWTLFIAPPLRPLF
jgi:hypothetical protein